MTIPIFDRLTCWGFFIRYAPGLVPVRRGLRELRAFPLYAIQSRSILVFPFFKSMSDLARNYLKEGVPNLPQEKFEKLGDCLDRLKCVRRVRRVNRLQ